MTWKQKAARTNARIEDFKKFVQTYGRCGYSRRQFFLDLASAVKSYELARDGDGERAYHVAMAMCAEVNATLDRPVTQRKLQEQVYAADPNMHRSSNTIRLDMGITDLIAEQLDLRTLIPPSLRVERLIHEEEEKACRAEQRAIDRARKADEKEAAKLQKKLEGEEQRRVRSATKPRVNEERDRRDSAVDAMLRQGRPTSKIESALGIHRQQVSRIRKRLVGAGVELPEQESLKRGRKKLRHTPGVMIANAPAPTPQYVSV